MAARWRLSVPRIAVVPSFGATPRSACSSSTLAPTAADLVSQIVEVASRSSSMMGLVSEYARSDIRVDGDLWS